MSAQVVTQHDDASGRVSPLGRERAVRAALALMGLAISTEVLLVLPVVGALSNLLVGMALVISVVAVVSGEPMARPPMSMVWLTVFVAYAGASYFWSLDPSISLVRLLTYLQLLLLALAVVVLATTKRRYDYLMGGYVLGATVVAGSVVVNYLAGNASQSDAVLQRFGAGFANPNRTAAILVVGLALATYLVVTGARPRGLWVGFMMIVPFAVLLTGSRSGLVSLVLTGLLSILWLGLGYPRHAKGLVVVSIAILVVVVFVPRSSLLRATDLTADSYGARSVNLRRAALDTGIEAMVEKPVVGSGAGTFPLRMEAYDEKGMAAHNSLVSVGVELGAVGVVLLAAASGSAWCAALRRKRTSWWLALTAGVALGVMVLFASFENDKISWFVLAVVSVVAAGGSSRSGEPAAGVPVQAADALEAGGGIAAEGDSGTVDL